MRDIATLYHTKMSMLYDYKFFFVEMRDDIQSEVEESGNYIYVKGVERFNAMFDKCMAAIRYLHKYSYDYILRTNLSSFWNIPKLFDVAKEFGIPYAGGISMDDIFLSGTGIILSRDVAYQLAHFVNDPSINDDVFISICLATFTILDGWDDRWVYWMVDDTMHIPDNISTILYFRIRNENRNIDVALFKELAKRMYSIDSYTVCR